MTIIDHNKYSPKTGAAKLGKSGNRQKAVFSIVFVIFLAYAICLLYPFFFCFNGSLMDGGRTFMRNQIAFPNPIKLGNYIKAFSELEVNDTDFFGMLLNSVWFSFGTAFLPIFFASMTSYVVCKYRFPGRNFLYSLVIVTMMIPIYGSLPAQYRLFDNLGMVDSPLILLYYCSGFGTNFLVIYSFFKGISWSYAEAAFLDGANEFQVFRRWLPASIFTKRKFPMRPIIPFILRASSFLSFPFSCFSARFKIPLCLTSMPAD